MPTVAVLNIGIRANHRQFDRGIDTVTKKLQGFQKLLMGGAAIAAAKRAAGAFEQIAAGIDQIAKTSSKLGIATDQLIGLHTAAERTGVSAQTFDMALQRMVRRVAEAAQGTGEAVKALEELGLSADRLNQLSPDKQLRRIADAMRTVPTQADRIRLAMKLFDSEGVALVNTLAGGAAALDEFQKEAEKLGNTFSTKQAQQVERFNDEMGRLRDITSSFGQKIVIDIAPEAADFLEGMTELVARMDTTAGGTAGSGTGLLGMLSGVSGLAGLSNRFEKFLTDYWTEEGPSARPGEIRPRGEALAVAGFARGPADFLGKKATQAMEGFSKTLRVYGKPLAEGMNTWAKSAGQLGDTLFGFTARSMLGKMLSPGTAKDPMEDIGLKAERPGFAAVERGSVEAMAVLSRFFGDKSPEARAERIQKLQLEEQQKQTRIFEQMLADAVGAGGGQVQVAPGL